MLLHARNSMCRPFSIGRVARRRGSRMMRLCRAHFVEVFEPGLVSWEMDRVGSGAVVGDLL